MQVASCTPHMWCFAQELSLAGNVDVRHTCYGVQKHRRALTLSCRFGPRLAGLQLSDDEIDELQPKAPKKWWQAWWWCLISICISLLVFCGGVVLRINLDESVSRNLIVDCLNALCRPAGRPAGRSAVAGRHGMLSAVPACHAACRHQQAHSC